LMPMILRFGLLMGSLSSFIFLLQLLRLLFKSSVISLKSFLSSSPEIQFSTCSSLM
jgi:hypothetical protein